MTGPTIVTLTFVSGDKAPDALVVKLGHGEELLVCDCTDAPEIQIAHLDPQGRLLAEWSVELEDVED